MICSIVLEPFDLHQMAYETLNSIDNQDDRIAIYSPTSLRREHLKRLDLYSVWMIFRVIIIPVLLNKQSDIDVLDDIDTLFAVIA